MVVNGLLFWKTRLTIPEDESLKTLILENEHDSKVEGHFGIDKTMELVQRNFYWPQMTNWVTDYIRSCDECQHNKSVRHKNYGLLQPLETPYAPWVSVSTDFIV